METLKVLWNSWKKDEAITHEGWVTYESINKDSFGSDNGLSPDLHQAITWTTAGLLSVRPSGTNFGQILIKVWLFSLRTLYFKMSVKWWPVQMFVLWDSIYVDLIKLNDMTLWNWYETIFFICSKPTMLQLWFDKCASLPWTSEPSCH